MSRAGAGPPDADGDVAQLHACLNEYLMLESKFQPRLCLPDDSESGEVTTGARDGAAHVLRCLKVWFDLPAEVLISAINLFDRFLTKMKVRPCHVPCITVSCMNLAIDEYAEITKQPRNVTVEELVAVSQSACTARDVARMSPVVRDKLAAAGRRPVTALHWARLLRALLLAAARELALPACVLPETELINLLEIAVCDAGCVNARTSELALVLVYHKLEQELVAWSRRAAEGGAPVPEDAYCLYEFAAQLQRHCHMSDASLANARRLVRDVAARYEARQAAPQRQRLVWRLSERTLKVLRPTDRLTSLLPTIEEQHLGADCTPKRARRLKTVTALHWARLLRALLLAAARELALPACVLPETELINLLEIAVCDAGCVNARTSELALVLVYHKLEQELVAWSRRAAEGGAPVPEDAYCLYEFAAQLQRHCHMSDASLANARRLVRDVAARYEARQAAPQRQRLVWRLSERTLKVLRPTDRLTSLLPTIEEQHLGADCTPKRARVGSESEETSDWPRSPVLPVYCDN